jgi:hypothetical protein
MFMPSTSVILLAIAVLAVLLALAWFVGGMAPNQRVARRLRANANKTGEASLAKKRPRPAKLPEPVMFPDQPRPTV